MYEIIETKTMNEQINKSIQTKQTNKQMRHK